MNIKGEIVDKARHKGMSVLSYFNLNPKTVSVDEAAEKLVKDLVGEGPDFDGNSSAHHAPSDEAGTRALAALQLLHRWEAPTQEGSSVTKETILGAKKTYLLQSGEKNKEKAAVDFDQAVEKLLVAKLAGRMRLFYIGKMQELERSIGRGEITKSEYDQELNLYLDEVKDPKRCPLHTEVKNALSMIEEGEPNAVNGLCYLFKAKLPSSQKKKLAFFDPALNKIIEEKFGASSGLQAEATIFRRAFIAEARRQLGSRLSSGFRAEYFAEDKQRLEEMKAGTIEYSDYVNSMRNWIAGKNLERQVRSALGNLKDRGSVIVLLSFLNYKKYNDPIRSGNLYHHLAHLRDQCHDFNEVAREYQEFHSFGADDEFDGYKWFLNEAERQLLKALPADIKKKLNDHKEILEGLVADEYIEKDEVKKNMTSYFSSIANGEDDKKSLIFDDGSDELIAKKRAAKTLVEKGLANSIRQNNREKDVLEALIMCWGGFVFSHRKDFSLNPLCLAKNEYLSIGKPHPSDETLMHFDFSGNFCVEARAQLVNFLSDDIRTLYQEREKILSSYYEKRVIKRETFRKSMESFLQPYFEGKKT